MQVKKQQLELDMEQWTVPNWERSTTRLYFVTLLIYITYMQGTSCNILGWMKHKLESRLPGEILITSDADDTPLMAESEEEPKSFLMKLKEEGEKTGLKLSIQKMKIWHLVASPHGK